MRLNELGAAVKAVLSQGDTACLIGGSGIGKTEFVQSLAMDLDAELVPMMLIYRDLVDLRGLPVVDPEVGCTRWLTPAEFLAGKRRKFFFFDELNHSLPAVQSACYQIFAEHKVGDMPLPPDSLIMAAMNRASDRGVWNQTPMPLRRRWFELQVEPDFESWREWAIKNGVNPLGIAYLKNHPDALYRDSVNGALAPDPRAWVKLFKLIGTVPNGVLHQLANGKIGEGDAIEFMAWIQMAASLPDLDDIIANPATAPIPSNPSILYAVCIGLAYRAKLKTFAAILSYLERLSPEYGILTVKDALMRDQTLTATAVYRKWVTANKKYLGI